MPWSERQRAMLREMGIRWWSPQADAPNEAVDDVLTADTKAASPLLEEQPVAKPFDGKQSIGKRPIGERPIAAPPYASDPPVGAPLPPQALGAEPQTAPDHAVAGIEVVARMGWATLRETVAGCTACRLCEGRRQTVFGIGHEHAHWLIVGEAPGEQEDRQGEPFVGKSGQLLDNMLRAVGLTRGEALPEQQVYIANTVKCRPPGNRNPEPDELATCEAYLVRQVQLLQPKIILAMGRFAVQSLLRSNEPVGRLRGRVHRYQRVPLIVTYHPAYLLRNLDDKAKAWDDLCLARETLRAESA